MRGSIWLAVAAVASFWASSECAWAGQAGGSTKVEAALVARVNGDPVTRAEFQRMLGNPLTRSQLQQERGEENPNPKELERLALQKVIHHRLMIQEAGRRNITISTAELDKAIVALRRRFGDLESFGTWMNEQGLDDKALFETIRGDMMSARLWGLLVEGVRIPEERVQQYYEAHKEELKTEEFWIQIIVVKEKAAAEEIQAALGRGEDFGRLAQQRSLGLRSAQGGDIGWVDSEILWPPMRDAVSTLKPGEAIGPLQKGDQFHIVRLQARRPGRTKTFGEAQPEIEQRLLAAERQAVVATWLAEQEKTAKIEVFRTN